MTPVLARTALLLLLVPACGGSTPPPAAAPSPTPSAAAPVAALTSASASPAPTPPAGDVAAIQHSLDTPERSADDRQLDPGRHPAEMLAFFGIAPGMKVAELGAGGGYTSEALARVVGPTGTVYGQNSKWILGRFAEKPWSARLTEPAMKNVVRLDREFDDPFPPTVRNLDAVLIVLFYHDTVWQKVDRAKMNRAVFDALRPGGIYGIVDHSSRVGAGLTDVQTLHRIDEPVVREEVEHAGFEFVKEADFLRNPADTRDWSTSPREAGARRGTSDRFVLEFVKP